MTESSKLRVSSGTNKPDQHRIFDNTLGNTQKLKMYTYTQATGGYSVSILAKRTRYRRVIAQLVASRGGGVISRTPRGPSELLRRSGFGCSRTSFQAERRRHLVPSLPVGEWTPHRSDCSTARPTAPDPAHPIQQRLSSTGSVLSPSSLAAAASWSSPWPRDSTFKGRPHSNRLNLNESPLNR